MKPTSKADIDGTFVHLVRGLCAWNKRQEEHVRNTKANGFYEPPVSDWDGDLFDLIGMAEPFTREDIHKMFAAVTNKDDPGTSGDYALMQAQGDTLGAAERAYRNRHASPVRNRLHAGGRHRGHGHEKGVIELGIMGYIHHLDNLTKANG